MFRTRTQYIKNKRQVLQKRVEWYAAILILVEYMWLYAKKIMYPSKAPYIFFVFALVSLTVVENQNWPCDSSLFPSYPWGYNVAITIVYEHKLVKHLKQSNAIAQFYGSVLAPQIKKKIFLCLRKSFAT